MRNLVQNQDDFKRHFRTHLKFLRQYNTFIEAGDTDYGRPAATALRNIFHGGRRSISLLQHLGAENVLIESKFGAASIPDYVDYYCAYGLRRNENHYICSAEYYRTGHPISPALSGARPASEWWEEIIFFQRDTPISIARNQLVLGMADKDGGAHIDRKLDSTYHSFINNSIQKYDVDANDKMYHVPFPGIESIMVRHLIVDLLESPDFLGLGD